jgi:hypothetical protein
VSFATPFLGSSRATRIRYTLRFTWYTPRKRVALPVFLISISCRPRRFTVIEIVPRHPDSTTGENESVQFLADKKKRSVRANTSRVQFTAVDRAPDAARSVEAQIGSGLSSRQVRPLLKRTNALTVISGVRVRYCRPFAHLLRLYSSRFAGARPMAAVCERIEDRKTRAFYRACTTAVITAHTWCCCGASQPR